MYVPLLLAYTPRCRADTVFRCTYYACTAVRLRTTIPQALHLTSRNVPATTAHSQRKDLPAAAILAHEITHFRLQQTLHRFPFAGIHVARSATLIFVADLI